MSWGSDLLKDAEQNWMWHWATGFTLRQTAILVGDCKAVSEKAQTYGFPERRTVLFPWGVDLKHFNPGSSNAFRERLGWQDAFVLLSLRSWEPLYGVDVFLRAFVQAAKLVPELRLILLGGGSQAPLLRQILMESKLMDRVYFGGQVSHNDLPEFYRTADLYVSASHSDGSSVSLMESLASGCPVLVSDIPGNLEWVTDGVQGWVFPDGDQDAIRDGILKAYHQKERLQKERLPLYGRAARSVAEKRANWSDNFQHLLNAYERAIANGRLSE
jgi:glycosyltransferase involved in cell wall biosynthesis